MLSRLDTITVFPATQYVTSKPTIERAVVEIKHELAEQVKKFESEGRMLEAHRIRQRTEYDLEMMQELGFCNGIENYSRILDGRPPGSAPHTLLDYFPSDFVVFVDESHQTVPQIGGMYEGDRSRKQTLVDFGFRLPSALDNRPLRFDEFLAKVPQLVFVSATPGAWELRHSTRVAEQLIRPTGIVDPEVELRPTRNQIDDLLNEIRRREERGERMLVTTLTKKMAEDLTDYLLEAGVRARYLHSEIDTLERIQIIRDLRLGEYDVLVGVNLLREGLDLPEVSLVAILDADKEGFLRGQTALIQTIGRAARNVNGKVLMYADKRTEAIEFALDETERRRAKQLAYNEEHGITPESITKGVSDIAEFLSLEAPHVPKRTRRGQQVEGMDRGELEKLVITLEEEMYTAAEELRFEYAAKLRDEIKDLRRELVALAESRGLGALRRAARRRAGSGAPREAPASAAPDVGLDRDLPLVGPVDEDAARLVRAGSVAGGRARAPWRARTRSPRPSTTSNSRRSAIGRLVDVAAEDQLGAASASRASTWLRPDERPLPRPPRRAGELVVERRRRGARPARPRAAGRRRARGRRAGSARAGSRHGRTEFSPTAIEPRRGMDRVRAPVALELAPRVREAARGKRRDVVVPGDDEERRPESAEVARRPPRARPGARGG